MLWSEDELRQQIAQVASRFGLFECNTCALAIKEFLIITKIPGKQIKRDKNEPFGTSSANELAQAALDKTNARI